MVFDTLYGMNSKLEITLQMVQGHTVGDDGRLWHDGERVLARDCTASIRRWSKRDAFGDALMKATDELSAPDDRKIRFRLRRPFPLLERHRGILEYPPA